MKKFITCAAISAVLFSGCALTKNGQGIIKVNGNTITQAEFEEIYAREVNNSPLKAFGGAANLQRDKDNFMYVVFKDKVVNELIIKSLIEAEIAKRGIKATSDDIKEEMKTIVDKVGSKEELNNLLKQRGISNSEFNKDLENQIKIKKLINSIQKVSVSDADAEKYYKTHASEFKHDEQVRASHILISADTLQIIRDIKSKNKDISPADLNKKLEETIAKQKAKAESILAEVKANPDNFEQIAQKKSDDKSSGERGGELGFFSKDRMVPEFSKAAFAMKPNTISETLVTSPYGFHIIKVTDRMEAGVTPLAKVKDEIKFYLETQEQIKVLQNLTAGLMKTAKIEYLDEEYKPGVNNGVNNGANKDKEAAAKSSDKK